MIKIIGYARVSTTKQDLSRQKLKIKEFCENNNYELPEFKQTMQQCRIHC